MFLVFHTGSVEDKIKMVCVRRLLGIRGGSHKLFCHLSGGIEKVSGETRGRS